MENLSVVEKKFFDYMDHIIENDKISHAYIIEVDNYEGDLKNIYVLLKMLMFNKVYKKIDEIPNNIINLIDTNNYPDIKIVEPAGINIKKSQLIELKSEYKNKSILNNKRIYIIKEADKLNQASGNTILKFLEEPENDIIALLLTNNRYNMLETILSRCQILSLKEKQELTKDEEDLLLFLEYIVNPQQLFIKYNYFINNYISDKFFAKEKLQLIEQIIIRYLNDKYTEDETSLRVKEILETVDEKKLLSTISIIEKELLKLKYNINYKMWLDSLFSKLIIGG